tara:strand:- start:1538 stop:1750 length:213 start_codon:yes stop_codon:yes gene_type:complete
MPENSPRLDKHLPPPSLACKTEGFCRHAFTSTSLYMPDFDDSLGGQTLGSNNNEYRLEKAMLIRTPWAMT